jgi:hypothetical protein
MGWNGGGLRIQKQITSQSDRKRVSDIRSIFRRAQGLQRMGLYMVVCAIQETDAGMSFEEFACAQKEHLGFRGENKQMPHRLIENMMS